MRKTLLSLSLSLIAASFAVWADTVPATTGDGIIQLSDMDLSVVTCYDDAGKTKARKALDTLGNPLVLKGNTYESGVGTHAPSKAIVELNGATTFHTLIGVTDGAQNQADHGIVDYTVTLYKDKVATVTGTGTVNRSDAECVTIDLSVEGYDYLELDFANGAKAWADHCAWADARFEYTGEAPQTVAVKYPTPEDAIVQLPATGPDGETVVPLSGMDLTKIINGWRTPVANKSIENNVITINGKKYASGVGIHATAKAVVKLNGSSTAFHCELGIDDEVAKDGNVNYTITIRKASGAEETIANGNMRRMQDAVVIDTPIASDDRYLIIDIDSNGTNECDHVDLANAYFLFVYQNSNEPELVDPHVLDSGLDCATTLFSQPNVRFMHRLHSQNPDIEFEVKDLPEGLSFNEKRSLVEGRIATEGAYTYTVVTTAPGEEPVETPVSLTVSSSLAQPTPFMGWISWNVVERAISEDVVKTVADNMVSSGLYDAGYNIIAMDDCWHASTRAADGKPQPDPTRFPNGIKPCADYVHDLGLKLGIYSDAADRTCAGQFGSLGKETTDANAYAEWGVDFLKYDYCGAPGDLATAKTRYKAMGDALKASGRNIIFLICEWGVREPWKWGAECGGSAWRSTYDVRDGWKCRNGGVGVVESLAGMKDLWPYTGVNRWNDADMLCVGINGKGKSSSDLVDGTPGMTKTEYATQFALWCMWASPLPLSFDLRNPISDADLAIMTNRDMIAIDQDPMGQGAQWLGVDGNQCNLMARDLENGDIAVAVVNMDTAAHPYTIDFAAIPGLDPTETYTVRDCQARQTLEGHYTGSLEIPSIARHETKVYRLSVKGNESAVGTAAAAAPATTFHDLRGVKVSSPRNGQIYVTAGHTVRL